MQDVKIIMDLKARCFSQWLCCIPIITIYTFTSIISVGEIYFDYIFTYEYIQTLYSIVSSCLDRLKSCIVGFAT